MSKNVEIQLEKIREAVSDAREALSESEDTELLGELLADAEGWKMTLEEAES